MKSEKIKHIYHVQGTFSLLVIIEQRRAWVEGSRGCAKQPGATVCGVELKTRRVERMTCSALYLLYFSNKCPMWFSTINRSMTSKKILCSNKCNIQAGEWGLSLKITRRSYHACLNSIIYPTLEKLIWKKWDYLIIFYMIATNHFKNLAVISKTWFWNKGNKAVGLNQVNTMIYFPLTTIHLHVEQISCHIKITSSNR